MQALRFAKEFRPRWLILENVVHMRPWSRYDELKDSLDDLGYNVSEFVLDASDFGVAQSRRRLFVVCDLEDVVSEIKRPRRKRKHVTDILDPPGKWGTTTLYSPNGPSRLWSEPKEALPRWANVPAFCWSITGRTAAVAGSAWTALYAP